MQFAKFVLAIATLSLPLLAEQKLEANIPFEFSVRGVTLPAGRYTVAIDPAKMMLVLTPAGQGAGVQTLLTTSRPETTNRLPRMLFENIQGRYRLAEVIDSGFISTFARTAAEREAMHGRKPGNRTAVTALR
jgi:hypothetical protein